MISVDVTYQIVSIKFTNSHWVTPFPTDHIQITGPISRDDNHISDNEAALEDDDFGISCAAYLVWGDRSINLTCVYFPSASLFIDFRECEDETTNATARADCAESVGVSMRDARVCGEDIVGAMTVDEDMRDDNGTPFLVLHVNVELHGAARLYGKRVEDR